MVARSKLEASSSEKFQLEIGGVRILVEYSLFKFDSAEELRHFAQAYEQKNNFHSFGRECC